MFEPVTSGATLPQAGPRNVSLARADRLRDIEDFDEAQRLAERITAKATAIERLLDSTAPTILRSAAQAIDDRAALRDCPDGERSMARCVAAFNAITGHNLTEVEGWHFMELLKLSRATAGGHHLDDHTDRAAYAALAGEAAERATAGAA